jgi:hypothetical protein
VFGLAQPMRSVVLVVLLSAAASSAALAQRGRGGRGRRIQVSGQRDLSFGTVFPGVLNTVRPTDATRGARYRITGPGGSQVSLTFLLPPVLDRRGGGRGGRRTLPIQFGPASAAYSRTGSLTDAIQFDPRLPITVTLDNRGSGEVFLGGTVLPAPGQGAGNYSVNITLSVTPADP